MRMIMANLIRESEAGFGTNKEYIDFIMVDDPDDLRPMIIDLADKSKSDNGGHWHYIQLSIVDNVSGK